MATGHFLAGRCVHHCSLREQLAQVRHAVGARSHGCYLDARTARRKFLRAVWFYKFFIFGYLG